MERVDTFREYLHRDHQEMEARIERDIERYRKGDFTLMAEPCATVKLEQLDHEFQYGCNMLQLDQFENEEKNLRYRRRFKEGFNLATIPFYWDALEPEQGKPRFEANSPFIYRRPPIDPCLDYCEQNGITPKAHCLNYDRFSPAWVKGRPAEEVKKLLRTRFEQLSARYAGRIPCWEVFNELLCNNGTTPFYDADDMPLWSFQQAEELFADNQLMTNEYTVNIFCDKTGHQHSASRRNPYYMLCEGLIGEGARLDAIGLQFHFFTNESNAEKYAKGLFDLKHHFSILDQMAKLGKPLQITEVTFPAYGGTAEEFEFQAELIRTFYRAWFSHPAMEGAVYWNLADGYAWGAEPGDFTAGENRYYGGLLNFELNPKPAFTALYDLFHKEYHTELTLTADENGQVSFRGFYGKYRVTCGDLSYITEFKRK